MEIDHSTKWIYSTKECEVTQNWTSMFECWLQHLQVCKNLSSLIYPMLLACSKLSMTRTTTLASISGPLARLVVDGSWWLTRVFRELINVCKVLIDPHRLRDIVQMQIMGVTLFAKEEDCLDIALEYQKLLS